MPHYRAPSGCTGAIDLRPLQEQGTPNFANPSRSLFFCSNGPLLPQDAPNYDLLGSGAWDQIQPNAAIQAKLPIPKGYKLQGTTLAAMVYDLLTGGSDVTGQAGPKPLMPTMDLQLELFCGPSSFVNPKQFQWGIDPHTPKVKALLHSEFAELHAAAANGELNDDVHHLRVLDFWMKKYRVSDWKEFVPKALHAEVPGPEDHETEIQDTFNRTNQTGLGTASGGFAWTALENLKFNIVSNACKYGPSANGSDAESANADLSSSDVTCQASVTMTCAAGFFDVGVACRKDSTATETLYLSDVVTATGWRVFKVIAGSFTQIGTTTSGTPGSTPSTHKLTANGSTLNYYVDGSLKVGPITDSSISSGTRCGMRCYCSTNDPGNSTVIDDFLAADLTLNSPQVYNYAAPFVAQSNSVYIDGTGGGAGGADGGVSLGGNGGGGGAAGRKTVTGLTIGNSYLANPGAAVAHGVDGNDSYFIDVTTALFKAGKTAGTGGLASGCIADTAYNGGSGGTNGTTGGGGGGEASGGAVAGNNGTAGSVATGGAGGTGTAGADGGAGGNATAVGTAGTSPGGGGGGGGSAANGGSGTPGQLTISWPVSSPSVVFRRTLSRIGKAGKRQPLGGG
jgi:hypothetical protein